VPTTTASYACIIGFMSAFGRGAIGFVDWRSRPLGASVSSGNEPWTKDHKRRTHLTVRGRPSGEYGHPFDGVPRDAELTHTNICLDQCRVRLGRGQRNIMLVLKSLETTLKVVSTCSTPPSLACLGNTRESST